MTVVSAIFRIRRDTAANWTSANPVLKLGEPGLETNTRKIKYGDGSTAWNSLPYAASDVNWGGIGGSLASQTDLVDALATLAPLGSPALTGNPTAPTPATSDNDVSIATTAYVRAAMADAFSQITTWTPTVSAASGTLTTTAVNSANFLKVGKLVFFSAQVTLTNHGTGGGALQITLPTTAGYLGTFAGRENALTGHQLQGSVFTASNLLTIFKYDGSSLIATGAQVRISGFYLEA